MKNESPNPPLIPEKQGSSFGSKMNSSSERDEKLTPSISIIIPFFNADKTIQRAFDSLNAQEGVDKGFFEVILVDDGSTEPFKEPAHKHFFPLKVFRTSNQGPLQARSSGVACALGEYVYFLDSDDWIAPAFMRDFAALMASSSFDVCLVGFKKKGGRTFEKSPFPAEIDEAYYCRHLIGIGDIGYSASKIFRRELFEGVTCDVQSSIAEDLLFSMSVFRPGCKYAAMPSVYYCYEETPNSLSSRVNAKMAADALFVLGQRESFIVDHPNLGYSYEAFLPDVRASLIYVRKMIWRCPRKSRRALVGMFYKLPCVKNAIKHSFQDVPPLPIKERAVWGLIKVEAVFCR